MKLTKDEVMDGPLTMDMLASMSLVDSLEWMEDHTNMTGEDKEMVLDKVKEFANAWD